jgi:hypothetical protein
LALGSAPAWSFSIDVNFDGSLSENQEQVFQAAAGYWESVLAGYIDGTLQNGVQLTGIAVNAATNDIDGLGSTLGSTALDMTRFDGRYRLATEGSLTLDSADMVGMESNGTLFDVVVHELAHAIGFGTLWEANRIYLEGSGQYTGSAALSVYRDAFDPDAAFIPVELDGGPGTADAHWDEAVFDSELMTGYIDATNYVDAITLASFVDIGYVLQPGALSVPLASGSIFALSALVPLLLMRRRGDTAISD